MDAENESLPTGEQASLEQQIESTELVASQTGNKDLAGQTVTPVLHTQRTKRFLEGFQPTPGSNVTRIYGLSDCVIAVPELRVASNEHTARCVLL